MGAAIIAAPFCWWLLSITVAQTATPEFSDILSQRFIVVAIVYSVLEEIAFRGVLQGWLLKQNWGMRRWYGVSNANIVASMLFTALHVVRRFNVLSLAVFVPSLVFGFFRKRYNNLTIPIALHIFYNAGVVLLFV